VVEVTELEAGIVTNSPALLAEFYEQVFGFERRRDGVTPRCTSSRRTRWKRSSREQKPREAACWWRRRVTVRMRSWQSCATPRGMSGSCCGMPRSTGADVREE
jgi:hypothetical protein